MLSRFLTALVCLAFLSGANTALAEPTRLVFFVDDTDPNFDAFPPVVTWHFNLFDPAHQPAGTLEVYGVATIIPPEPEANPTGILTFVAAIDGGSVTGQGVFKFDDEPFVMAITGGTGRYRRARGEMRVVPHPDAPARIVMRLLD